MVRKVRSSACWMRQTRRRKEKESAKEWQMVQRIGGVGRWWPTSGGEFVSDPNFSHDAKTGYLKKTW